MLKIQRADSSYFLVLNVSHQVSCLMFKSNMLHGCEQEEKGRQDGLSTLWLEKWMDHGMNVKWLVLMFLLPVAVQSSDTVPSKIVVFVSMAVSCCLTCCDWVEIVWGMSASCKLVWFYGMWVVTDWGQDSVPTCTRTGTRTRLQARGMVCVAREPSTASFQPPPPLHNHLYLLARFIACEIGSENHYVLRKTFVILLPLLAVGCLWGCS